MDQQKVSYVYHCSLETYCAFVPAFSDYFPLAIGILPYIPGDDNCLTIPLNDDDEPEETEVFTITFSPDVPGAPSSTSTVTILDNDQRGKHTTIQMCTTT